MHRDFNNERTRGKKINILTSMYIFLKHFNSNDMSIIKPSVNGTDR